MQRRLIGAVVALLVALGCSACGTTQHRTVRSKTVVVSPPQARFALPSSATLVIVPPQHGAGDEDFGTFTASGTVSFEFSCKGEGPFTLVRILSHISPCDGSPTEASIPYHAGETVHVAVQAKPGTTWRLAVGEHVPGADLVLIHSSGVGNRTFRTFQLRGRISVATSCRGRGNLDVGFNSTSSKVIPGSGTYCPEAPGAVASFDVPGGAGSAGVYLDAGPKVRWTLTISEHLPK